MNEWGLLARGCPKWVLGLSTSTSAGGPRLFNRLAGLAKQDGRWSREGERRRFPSVAMAAGRALRAPPGRCFRLPFTKPRAWGERGGQGGFTLGTPGMGS